MSTGTRPEGGSATYTFGDSTPASTRLRLLSEVFAPSTAAFLRAVVPAPPDLAVDLGCGPGHSTRLVADTTGARRTVGIDNSPQFLGEAQEGATESVAFLQHDVTVVPFPVPPADLVYQRFLLMHLPDRAGVLRRWSGAMAPGGRLVLQESEGIDAAHAAFDAYLDIVAGMLAETGGVIYLGPWLERVEDAGPLRRVASRVWTIDVPADVVARLYSLNVASWRDQPYVRDHVPAAELDRLVADLDRLATTRGQPGIAWHVRGVAFELPHDAG